MKGNYFTAQEHRTFGSTVRDEQHYERPYVPIGIIDGKISVEECNEERMRIREIGAISLFWGIKSISGTQRLESLNLDKDSKEYGFTLRDNLLVEAFDVGNKRTLGRKIDFPFAREENPRVKLG